MEAQPKNEIDHFHFSKHPLRALQRFDKSPIGEVKDKSKGDYKSDEEKNFILCRNCKNTITTRNDIIEINGNHKHTFKNPSGIAYQIGCFLTIRGCFIMGAPTTEHTWFPGFSWCYVICSNCLIHLGWNFQSSGSNFYGLILDNLLEG